MPNRSIESTVTFASAFSVGETTGQQPPGTYRVTIDEEEISGISTLAYRRVATLLHTPPLKWSGPHQVFTVDAAELEVALSADQAANSAERRSL